MICGSAAALPEGAFDEFASVSASAVTDGDWEYVVLDDDTISLTKYNGGGGTVTIPSTFEGKDVVSFGTIFKGNNNIAKVIIPDTVTNIADNAFNNCTNLTGVTIGSGVTNIGDYAFYNCNALTSITFPNGLTNIGNYAFYDCYGIKSVVIPGSVKSIGAYSFARTESYVNRGKDDTPPPVGYQRFTQVSVDGCWYHWFTTMSITSVYLEEGLEKIGIRAFYNCYKLKHIVIPKSVTSIDQKAFGFYYFKEDSHSQFAKKDPLYRISCFKDSVGQVYSKNCNIEYELIDVKKVDAKEPTCLELGNKEYWVCVLDISKTR